ncbi:MAG: glycosyltransferase [Eubacteriales bacterium]
MVPISVCIIAKNEEDYLSVCLQRLEPYGFELIVVDTGSTDQTIIVAREYTSHVYTFTWCDDFSKARNYGISKATNDWILTIDCDEHLTKLSLECLTSLLPTLSASATIGSIQLQSPFLQNGVRNIHTSRLARFFSKTYFHYEGRIHEQIVPISKNTEASILTIELPISLYHEGYGDEAIIRSKSLRNLQLLEQDLQRGNKTPYIYFQLGQSYFTLQEYEKAVEYFRTGLEMEVNPAEEYVQTMVESYGYALLNLKRFSDALLLERVYDTFNRSADYVFLMGLIYMNNALFEQAIEQFHLATTYPTCFIEGVNSYSAYYNMGVIYECSNRIQLAIEHYTLAGDYEPAKNRLNLLT